MTSSRQAPNLVFVRLLLVAVMASTDVRSEEPKHADPEGEAIKEKVLFQIHQNDFRLPSLRCKLTTTTLDSRVKEREVFRATTPDGGAIEFTLTPKSVAEVDVILARACMRADAFDPETNQRWSVSMCHDVWTTYNPAHKFARRKPRHEMGGESNIDPRNVGVFEARKSLVQELKRLQVERHETVYQTGSERIALDLSETFPESQKTMTTHYEFDPAKNCLPTRVIGVHPESKQIIWVHDIVYQQVLTKSAWFLKQSRVRFFADKPPIGLDADDGWTQQVTTEVIGELRMDESIADSDFRIPIPPGINFIDQTPASE